MQDEMYDKDKYYCYLYHEEWCELLSTMEGKDNQKWAADQIKRLASSKDDQANSDIDARLKVTCNKKTMSGVLISHNNKGKKTLNHKYSQCYYVLFKKVGMTDRKYKQHISEKCFGCRYKQ